ncbi:ester cyclase [Paraburkholderia sp.]|uniref:nuclear transport factor 2 family protein n=1 Tax=Paraburkholderia sp. TaxID=1926495 RepID=UPI002D2EE789|nr:ester cyclase [Paraburkholderia sp.]HZZ02692.1 ester cyclase [Paraburkholderia sp.]
MSINLGSYKNVPDFIYGITREIWEDRGIGAKLQKYYAPDILLRAATGFTGSNDGVTAQTLQTLHQFPDRQLVGEDVIWTPHDDGTFLSSHRLTSVMRHTGDGILGKAQGRTVRSRIIADCWVRDQVVVEEWLVRDQAAFARCLGMEPRSLARDMTDRDIRNGVPISYFAPEHDKPGHYKAAIEDDPTVDTYCKSFRRLWHDKETAVIRDLYFHGAAFHAPGGDVLYGHGDIDTFALGYLASFPDAVLKIETARVNRDPEQPVRVAIRWSLTGTHSGFGHFGEPTGAPVYVMGMSHVNMTGNQVMTEYMVTDEVSIWKQIFAHIESKAGA